MKTPSRDIFVEPYELPEGYRDAIGDIEFDDDKYQMSIEPPNFRPKHRELPPGLFDAVGGDHEHFNEVFPGFYVYTSDNRIQISKTKLDDSAWGFVGELGPDEPMIGFPVYDDVVALFKKEQADSIIYENKNIDR